MTIHHACRPFARDLIGFRKSTAGRRGREFEDCSQLPCLGLNVTIQRKHHGFRGLKFSSLPDFLLAQNCMAAPRWTDEVGAIPTRFEDAENRRVGRSLVLLCSLINAE